MRPHEMIYNGNIEVETSQLKSPEQGNKSDKILVIITGMHRSGTSLLGNIVSCMGVSMGDNLIEADEHNQGGYYEDKKIVDLNEKLLINLQRWWPGPGGTLELPEGWKSSAQAKNYKKELQNELTERFSEKTSVLAIKDPRISLILPIWEEIAKEVEIRVKIVISVRDPAEVISSLITRDGRSVGMTIERGEELWWRHNAELYKKRDSEDCLFVSYRRWFDDKKRNRQLKDLEKFLFHECGKGKKERLSAGNKIICPERRRSHKNENIKQKNLSSQVKKLYKELENINSKKGSQNAKELREKSTDLRKNRTDLENWFDETYYRDQRYIKNIWWGLMVDYKTMGWRMCKNPNVHFEANYYKHKAFESGIDVNGPPLLHFLAQDNLATIMPNDYCKKEWINSNAKAKIFFHENRLIGMHPWACAAYALCSCNVTKAISKLREWNIRGINKEEIDKITKSEIKYFGGLCLNTLEQEDIIRMNPRLEINDCTETDWYYHLWIDYIGLKEYNKNNTDSRYKINVDLERSIYNIESQKLLRLCSYTLVLCTSKEVAELYRRLNINARHIKEGGTRDYLERSINRVGKKTEISLIDPNSLETTRLMIINSLINDIKTSKHYSIPGLEEIEGTDKNKALQIAYWIKRCYEANIQLVWITQDKRLIKSRFWEAIGENNEKSGAKKPQLFHYPISDNELIHEIEWRNAGCKTENIVTPNPKYKIIYRQDNATDARATVCISLYNYSDSIECALNSVYRQTERIIDLIIVDDKSTDNSSEVTANWINQNKERFNNLIYIQHNENSGLAAARNTAIELAKTEWCYILDADNSMMTDAIERSADIAEKQDLNDIAVVFSKIKVINKDREGNKEIACFNNKIWQKENFRTKNANDAMGLVSKKAWKKVKGYEHIIGGWEDYDYWCKLIDNEYKGIFYPRVLASYNVHSNSMIHKETKHGERRISRLLQKRHEWLDLALAKEHLTQYQ